MLKKLFAFKLSVTLLLVQSSLIFAQTKMRGSDELVALLNEPEAVIVFDVRKIISDVIPTLFNGEASSIVKLQAAVRTLETDLGFNPYEIDRIVFGMKLGKTTENPMLVLQVSSATSLAEKIYQNKVESAKLANELNPIKQRILIVKNSVDGFNSSITDGSSLENIKGDLDSMFAEASSLQQKLSELPKNPANAKILDALESENSEIIELIRALQVDIDNRSDLTEFTKRVEDLEKQAADISARHPQRAAKIAELEKNVRRLELDFIAYKSITADYRAIMTAGKNAPPGIKLLPQTLTIEDLPSAEPKQSQDLRAIQKSLATAKKQLGLLTTEVKSQNTKPAPSATLTPAEINPEALIYAISTVVTRKDEVFEGKKTIVVGKKEKFPELSLLQEKNEENVMLILDDQTLLLGDRQTIAASLTNKTATRNQTARSLIAKSPDALVAFGVDLRSVDLGDLSNVIGEQKTAWQAFGALTSTGNDLTLSASVEKTDVPVEVSSKIDAASTTDKTKTSVSTDNAINELIDLLMKSLITVEGKLTLRFEKKKAMTILIDTPAIIAGVMRNRSGQPSKSRYINKK